ncbi:DNA-directed RNA polymerase III RPC11, partial [Toxoplasma gondii CAST]
MPFRGAAAGALRGERENKREEEKRRRGREEDREKKTKKNSASGRGLMALFCPTCHNMLLVRQEVTMQFHCRTCPYVFNIKEKLTRKMPLTPKKADEPLDESQEAARGAKAPGKHNFHIDITYICKTYIHTNFHIHTYIPIYRDI